jgi:hypothetical protein
MPIPRAYKNDPRAPWNDDPADECPECGELIHEVDSHAEDCPDKMGPEELAEYYHEQSQPEYDPVEHKNL